MSGITQILNQVNQAADPVETIRALVLEQGGHWYDPETSLGIVEIQLAGLVGIGPSVPSAVDDWILQARATEPEVHPLSA
jgi:hypothetical protein